MSLATLRSDPGAVCMRNVYRSFPAGDWPLVGGDLVEGGPCMIGAKEVQAGFFDLTAHRPKHSAFRDYFFPWLQRGVGWVKVPKNAPDGTIVLTGGVNGCTVVVSEQGNDFYFYHDGDSKYLKPGTVRGNEVARVAPGDYDPQDFALNHFSSSLAAAAGAGVKPVGDVSYGHFLVTVKKNGQFLIYATGVMSLNGLSKVPSPNPPLMATFG